MTMITAAMIDQYRDEGYFILERAIEGEELELLLSGAQFAIDRLDRQMDEAGVDRLGINAKGKRYFSNMVYQERPELRRFLFGDTMAGICRAVLGDDAYLFWEQYVIKAADPDTSFAWHQDSGYVHENHEPYLTCWIALDDVTEENGSVYLLPYSRSGIRSYIKHLRSEKGDEVCYFGSDPGMPVIVPAGSIVCFSSTVIHRSGPNLTDRLRRVYLAQYSSEVIMDAAGEKPWGSFEQFLGDGKVIAKA
ncbi:phytanoyl-CoA dioxygenase family protein [Microlunatus parietis]|uniref:Ectoine hydroxylase-related dioxygenase (Phytanoyl-CoA dioxygenase family) n=1 Tax=Microlunatus parietis TaxID=682979 RepID=A0A7Y9I7P6_9ACTN|nr:phytanoyl-CoA dioxygenase family protein [Microlunatus parietis]NYE71511.1 ectoine hydroxylase-related dioxygenase (phytanoyl-CoA dioxygenase family) [Microlunatus parietis]